LQARLQVLPLQDAVPFGDVVHGVQDVEPHDMTLLFDTHMAEQMW
jgi:hypothetical protein